MAQVGLLGALLVGGLVLGGRAAYAQETFSHASFTPLSADTMRARWSTALEIYATADWSYAKHRKLCFGGGLSATSAVFEARQDGKVVDLEAKDRSESELGPLLVLQDVEGPVLFGVTFAPLAQAGRLDIGVVFGR